MLSIASMPSMHSSSEPIFYPVIGFIKYQNGSFVCNATVYVKNLDKGIIKEYKISCDDPGFYQALFKQDEFEIGDRLCVEAFKGNLYGKVVTKFTQTNTGYKIVNITLLYQSPSIEAFATGPVGASSDGNITITYVYNGSPDYVSIYYSNDENRTWHLAGNDSNLDGKFNYTLPCNGKYGFIAVAIGGGSNESLPEENEPAECYPYIFDSSPPCIEITEPLNNSYVKPPAIIKWNASDNFGIESVAMQYSTDKIHWMPSSPIKISGEEYVWEATSNFPDAIKLWLKLIAVDNADNAAHDIVTFTLDKSPPSTTLQYGMPYYNNGNDCITSHTQIYLNATDDIADVNSTWYRIWHNGWSSWMPYTTPFFISDDGLHYIEFYSVDNAGNCESLHNATVHVDDSPPVISGVTASPSSQVSGGKVNITCVIIDSTGVDGVYLEVTYPDSSFSNFTMHHIPCTTYYREEAYSIVGTYNFTIYAKDMLGNANKTGIYHFTITSANSPPEKPNLTGPTNGVTGVSYTYSTHAIDPDGDTVYYFFDWGDGSNSGWLGPYTSGNVISSSHMWGSAGVYNVRVKAKDSYGHESDWSGSLAVTITLPNSPPVTRCSITPSTPDGENGWYLCSVNVSLSATDPDGDAIAYTKYRIDSGAWHDYTMPFEISQDGNHTLEFYSVDDKGNIESVKIATIKIDRSKPTVSIEKPLQGYLYIFNRQFLMTGGNTIIIGRIVVRAFAYDAQSDLQNVSFYVDDRLQNIDMAYPYEWLWRGAIGYYYISIEAYNKAGLKAESAPMLVYIFSL